MTSKQPPEERVTYRRCIHCKTNTLLPTSYERIITHCGRDRFLLLSTMECTTCGCQMTSNEQHNVNLRVIKAAKALMSDPTSGY